MTIGAAERLVPVQEGLDPVGASRERPEALERISKGRGVDDHLSIRSHSLHVEAEDLLGLESVGDLESRLVRGVGRDHQEQAAVDGLVTHFGTEPDGKARPFLDGLSRGWSGGQ